MWTFRCCVEKTWCERLIVSLMPPAIWGSCNGVCESQEESAKRQRGTLSNKYFKPQKVKGNVKYKDQDWSRTSKYCNYLGACKHLTDSRNYLDTRVGFISRDTSSSHLHGLVTHPVDSQVWKAWGKRDSRGQDSAAS